MSIGESDKASNSLKTASSVLFYKRKKGLREREREEKMRTVRTAYHYRWKALRVNQRADKLKRTKLRRTLGQQKGGFVGAAASALGDYTAKYSLDYSNYKTDANGLFIPLTV